MKTIMINGMEISIKESDIKTIHKYSIGDPIKVFVRDYSSFELCPGIVTGYASNGTDLLALAVTIVRGRSTPKLEVINLTEKDSDKYYVASEATEDGMMTMDTMIRIMESEIQAKTLELELAESRLAFVKKSLITIQENKEKGDA